VTADLKIIIEIWQPSSPERLEEADGLDIVRNLSGFFNVLADWQAQDALSDARREEPTMVTQVPPLSFPQRLTTAEVAKLLRVRKPTVEKYCRDGELPSARIGRQFLIDPADVEKFIRDRMAR